MHDAYMFIANLLGAAALAVGDRVETLAATKAGVSPQVGAAIVLIAMRPGQDELTKTVNDFVARNTANGELNKLYQKWLGADLPKLQ